jgi:hypothetical protein
LRLFDTKRATDEEILSLLPQLQGILRDQSEDILLKRQHRPTVERHLARLLGNDAVLRGGETSFPDDSPLDWITQLDKSHFWPRLETLRAMALRLDLPRVAGIVTDAMRKIDLDRLARVARKQLPITPVAWRDIQKVRVLEYEHEARLQRAQQTSFEVVLRSMERNSSLRRFKIWCEGPTDVPVYMALLEMAGLDVHDVVVQQFGGWANILSPQWTPRGLDDGCHDLMFICDGDRGRDYAKADRPLKPDIKRVVTKLTEQGIDMVIMTRYAIENYFPQTAYERVVGKPLAAYFPLPEDKPVKIPGYSKALNLELARQTTYADLRGSDLYRTLEAIKERTPL